MPDVIAGSQGGGHYPDLTLSLEGSEASRPSRASFACQAGAVIARQRAPGVHHFYSSHGRTGYPAFRRAAAAALETQKCFSMLFVCFCSIKGGPGGLMKLFTALLISHQHLLLHLQPLLLLLSQSSQQVATREENVHKVASCHRLKPLPPNLIRFRPSAALFLQSSSRLLDIPDGALV